MDNLIVQIPPAPDSLTTVEARELFMDLCLEKIQQQQLTAEVLEAIAGYCFLTQISNICERWMIRHPDKIYPIINIYDMTIQRELEYSEVLGLTPLDRRNLSMKP